MIMDPAAPSSVDTRSATTYELEAGANSSDKKAASNVEVKTLLPPAAVTIIPDGGWQAWSTLVGAYVNSFGVYEDLYVREYLNHSSSSAISWIGSTQTFCLFSIGIFSGYAMDIGYFRQVMFAGSVLFVFCLFMISISQPQKWYQLFLAQGIGLGIAIGSTYVPALGVVAHHFKRWRSLVMGVVASASSLGGVVHPIMLNKLIHGRLGFAWGVRCSAFLNLALLAVANALMTTRLPPQSKKLSHQIAYWRVFFKDRTYVVATAGTFLLITAVFFPIFYLQLDAVDHSVDQTLAFYTRIRAGSSIVDRTGVFNLIVPCTLACGVLIFSMVAISDLAGTIVIAILYGFFSGACISLLGPMLANLSKDASEVGARIGVCFGIGGPPITGALLTSQNIWIRPAVFCGVRVFFFIAF
ncbi:MFS general substrate transporter [Phellopilus nigrolimitatus]|nr:MFS general substrate transporter [Phellopilus nigrolimitatus]